VVAGGPAAGGEQRELGVADAVEDAAGPFVGGLEPQLLGVERAGAVEVLGGQAGGGLGGVAKGHDGWDRRRGAN
jgi:hypothetical protein